METPTILSTTDYDQFRVMDGNRNIDTAHVDKLRVSMIENLEGFKVKPAVVNKDGYIIDGQHRWTAAKLAGLPFYYVVGENMNLMTARAMNIRQKQWTLADYAQSYAAGNNSNYKLVLDLVRKTPALPLGVVVNITSDSAQTGYDIMHDFRQGNFIIKPVTESLELTEFYNEIAKRSGRRINVPFVRVMNIIMKSHPDFSRERFLRALEMGAELYMFGLAKDNYRAIEDVYNYHKQEGNKVRFY